jgi:predicted DNA-binding transcriptional regulator YafY
MPGPAAALGLGPAAARAANKLLASLPGSWSNDAQRISARFHLDPVDWYRVAEELPHLPVIARAVLDQRRVVMKYESWTGTRQWRIDPLGLVLKAGAWYVVARSGEAIRIFKVANMLEHTVMDATFERPNGFDLAAFWAAELQRFEAGLRPGSASLRASAIGLQRLAQLGAYAAQAVQRASMPDAEGWARLDLPIENADQAALALLGLGPEVEVLAPAAVRDRLRTYGEQMIRLHS